MSSSRRSTQNTAVLLLSKSKLLDVGYLLIWLAGSQVALDGFAERIRQLLIEDATLAGLSKSATNAFRLYKRTRPAASAESLARTRLQAPEGVHPLLAAAIPASALAGLEAQVRLAFPVNVVSKICVSSAIEDVIGIVIG